MVRFNSDGFLSVVVCAFSCSACLKVSKLKTTWAKSSASGVAVAPEEDGHYVNIWGWKENANHVTELPIYFLGLTSPRKFLNR